VDKVETPIKANVKLSPSLPNNPCVLASLALIVGIIFYSNVIFKQFMPIEALDDIDRKILSVLQTEGRITNQELADLVGLSPSPCLRRVRHLEQSGVIANYVALLDPNAVGLGVTAFVRVRLNAQDDIQLARFETAIAAFSEVMECYLMTGDSDYQIRVLVGSLQEFEDFLRQKLTRLPGVSQVTSSFALRPIVYRTALPVTAAQQ
jgi:Lrp/AsnC family transcriptional regulator, leucine-responsive regulatory protein